MYEELVTHLRECAKLDPSENTFSAAADAIEKLSKDRDKWEATAKEERAAYWHWFDNYQKDVPRWISVMERLPEENGFYLCLYKSIGGDEGLSIQKWHNGRWNLNEIYAITHWMPLPKAPKEE